MMMGWVVFAWKINKQTDFRSYNIRNDFIYIIMKLAYNISDKSTNWSFQQTVQREHMAVHYEP